VVVEPVLLGRPTLAQAHNVVGSGIDLAVALDAPALAFLQSLGATGVTIGAIAAGQPLLGQAHDLTGIGVDLSALVLAAAEVEQVYSLLGNGILLAAPVIDGARLGLRWIFVRYAGAWSQPTAYAKHEGIWKPVTAAWLRRSGVWSKVYE
jgi:hypothetical protein